MEGDGVPTLIFRSPASSSHTNDNYCLDSTWVKTVTRQLDPVSNLRTGVVVSSHSKSSSVRQSGIFRNSVGQDCKYGCFCGVVNPVFFANFNRHPQKKGFSPNQKLQEIKCVKGVFCVNPCLSVPVAPSAPNVVKELDVGGRLQKFWQKWQELGTNPRVVSILNES